MFFTAFAVVSTLRTSNDGICYYNSSACCALVFGLHLDQTMFSLGSSCFCKEIQVENFEIHSNENIYFKITGILTRLIKFSVVKRGCWKVFKCLTQW